MELEGKISAALKSITQALQVKIFLKLRVRLSTVNLLVLYRYYIYIFPKLGILETLQLKFHPNSSARNIT